MVRHDAPPGPSWRLVQQVRSKNNILLGMFRAAYFGNSVMLLRQAGRTPERLALQFPHGHGLAKDGTVSRSG